MGILVVAVAGDFDDLAGFFDHAVEFGAEEGEVLVGVFGLGLERGNIDLEFLDLAVGILAALDAGLDVVLEVLPGDELVLEADLALLGAEGIDEEDDGGDAAGELEQEGDGDADLGEGEFGHKIKEWRVMSDKRERESIDQQSALARKMRG